MIFDGRTLPLPARIRADVCVVGSGPGGATAAAIAAEAGLDVVVLEAGEFVTPGQMNHREEDMMPRLLRDAGASTATNRAVRILQGHGVGGSSLHNLNLVKRIPNELLHAWHRDRRLSELPVERWHALYDEMEALLSVSAVEPERFNRHNRLLLQGAEALGWQAAGLSHNRSGCIEVGFCALGCAYDAKNNALKVFVPRLIEAGGQIVTCARAHHVTHEGGRVTGVRASIVDPATYNVVGEVIVDAPRVVLAASATGTASLLLRSDIPDPSGQTGRTLRIHPAVLALGIMDEPVRAWTGIPQSVECTQWLQHGQQGGHRIWIVPAFAHPMAFATMLTGHGELHREVMESYDRIAVFTAMLHEHTAGQVSPSGDLDFEVDYWPTVEDRAELAFGVWAVAKLLFAAGATRVMLPTDPPRVVLPGDDLEALKALSFDPGTADLTGVHPMGTVPMGDDPLQAAVDSRGHHHHVRGLWVSDGSLFPTSTGGPPQLSIYALGLHVGRHLVAAG